MNLALSKDWQVRNDLSSVIRKIGGQREIEIELGDTKVPDALMPQAKFSFWNEANFSLRAELTSDFTIVNEDGKVKHRFQDGSETWMYELPEASNDGGLEFEWILPSKPATNQLRATIRTKGLHFYKQPAFDSDGVIQSDLIGSYAVYHEAGCNNHSSKSSILTLADLTDEDLQWLNLDIKGRLENPRTVQTGRYKGVQLPALHKDYLIGKAFHILRPKAFDRNDKWVYCEIDIDVNAETLTVTIPQDFLDSASYPIRVDPTFGYTTAGASTVSIGQVDSFANTGTGSPGTTLYTASTGDTVNTYHINLGSGTTTASVLMTVYDISATLPNNRAFAGTSVTTTSSSGWHVSGAVSQALTNATQYCVACAATGTGTGIALFVNSDVLSGQERSVATLLNLPNPWVNNGTNARRYSLFVTYTAGGGGGVTIPKFYHHYLQQRGS